MRFFRGDRPSLTPSAWDRFLKNAFRRVKTWWRKASGSAQDEPPFRGELLSLDLLRQYARNLAENRRVEEGTGPNLLLPRLAVTERILRDYNERTLLVEKTRSITPAAEWLVDNFHLIEDQIRTIQRHLPRSFHHELPRLQNGPLKDFPRVYEIAADLVSHTDGRIDASHLTSFVAAYQEVAPLKLGELWAVPIMLRLALIENLRRVAVTLTDMRRDRDEAEHWASHIFEVAEKNPAHLIIAVGDMARAAPRLSRAFATAFFQRMQEKTPPLKLPVSWIEERLADDGLNIQQLMQAESQFQATTQVSVGNSIGSLRFLDTVDWRDFVEEQSVVEKILRTDPAGVYPGMDFATRDAYRHTVERVAKWSRQTESAVADLAVTLARERQGQAADDRLTHVGFFLTGKGVAFLENRARVRIPWSCRLNRAARKFPLTCYLGAIFLLSLAATWPLLAWIHRLGVAGWILGVFGFLIALCASQLAVSLVNWFCTVFVKPTPLPSLDYSEGVPPARASLVAVPTLLTSVHAIETLIEALEVRYLANADHNVYFALLTDFTDASSEHLANDDELLSVAAAGISELNEKYKNDRPSIFYLLHRPRRWNSQERIWMGYERKRGKLADLNHLLRGGPRDHFSKIVGDLATLPHIKYVITLDSDTQLPRDAARHLIGAMSHPLNRPVYNDEKGLVVEGYTILQPRVAISLPSAGRSHFVKLFGGEPGIDPYTRSVSDVYQDVFQEGSFIGKGIYDVDAFERAVGGKFPENSILSHDLLEGNYARSALVSDVQLFEEFPARYSADARRRHRWIRGDWQITAWLLPRLPGMDVRRVRNPLSGLSRWKIFDNLRRSLVPAALVLLLLLGWAVLPSHMNIWGVFILAIIALPPALTLLLELCRPSDDLPLNLRLGSVGRQCVTQFFQIVLTIAFLAYDAVISLDAISRTLGRLFLTRRKLLEWQTAHDVDQTGEGSLRSFFRAMWSASFLSCGAAALFIYLGGPIPTLDFTFLVLWAVSPALAWWISLPPAEVRVKLSGDEILQLRKLSRKTWNFFETFVTEMENWLPPDNFQEYPRPVIATRTSPTNLGLGLLSALAAYDFGYLSVDNLILHLQRTIGAMEKLEKYRGHFYNWYDTRTLKPLPPPYISTVDNGNLAGHLLTLHAGLLELPELAWNGAKVRDGLRDTFDVLQELAAVSPGQSAL